MKTYNFSLTEAEAKAVIETLRTTVVLARAHPDIQTAREHNYQLDAARRAIEAEILCQGANVDNPLNDSTWLREQLFIAQRQIETMQDRARKLEQATNA